MALRRNFPRGVAFGTHQPISVLAVRSYGLRRSTFTFCNAGQLMNVSISSTENKAVSQNQGSDGAELPGARSGDDTMNWSGKLLRSGDYRIVVGSTRGNARSKLAVGIR